MTPAALASAAHAMFGPMWQTPLARELGVTPRHVRHWFAKNNPRPLPANIEERLRTVQERRLADVQRAV
ncbi:MAG: adhesin [Patescibacteria group bacterium]|nr:adhesin [Patescibacteria group bacterium]